MAHAEPRHPRSPLDRLRRLRRLRLGWPATGVHPRLLAAVLGLACLGGSAYLFASYRSETRLQRATELGRQGRYLEAAREAAAIGTAPTRVAAEALIAYADLAAGKLAAAEVSFRRAVAASPHDWTLRADWASTLLLGGQRARARAEMAAALVLNPMLTLPRGFCAARPRRGSAAGVALCRR